MCLCPCDPVGENALPTAGKELLSLFNRKFKIVGQGIDESFDWLFLAVLNFRQERTHQRLEIRNGHD